MKQLNISARHMEDLGVWLSTGPSEDGFTHRVRFLPQGGTLHARIQQHAGFVYICFQDGNLWRCTMERMKELTDYFPKLLWTVTPRNKRVS